ncbi:MAG: TRAP transporter substrate-binding protein DctP [Pseudomonadota bacterium]
MKNKRLLMPAVTVFVIFIVAVAALTEAFAKPPKKIVLKAVQFVPVGSSSTYGFPVYADLVNKASKGELSIVIVGGPEAIPGRQQPESIKSGASDLAYFPASYAGALVPEARTFALSRLTAPEERKSGFYDLEVELFAKANIRYLAEGAANHPFYIYTKNKRAETPQDLRGIRIRTAPLFEPLLGELGIRGVSMAHGDAYTALERGVIDGVLNPLDNYLQFHWQEVTKYVVGPPFWGVPSGAHVIAMNLDKWNSLPKHLKKVMLSSAVELELLMLTHYTKVLTESKQKVRDAGIEFVEWSPADTEWFLEMVDRVTWKSYGPKLEPSMVDKLKSVMGY